MNDHQVYAIKLALLQAQVAEQSVEIAKLRGQVEDLERYRADAEHIFRDIAMKFHENRSKQAQEFREWTKKRDALWSSDASEDTWERSHD